MKVKEYVKLLNIIAEKYPDLPVVCEYHNPDNNSNYFHIDFGPTYDKVIVHHDGYEKQKVICLN